MSKKKNQESGGIEISKANLKMYVSVIASTNEIAYGYEVPQQKDSAILDSLEEDLRNFTKTGVILVTPSEYQDLIKSKNHLMELQESVSHD